MEPATRADLHVHSRLSRQSAEWFRRKIDCPECSTPPEAVYRLARQRGMDFVTITDHDSIDGALEIAHLPGAFLSEEVTACFPEDGVKVHVVALNTAPANHQPLQERRGNLYDLVAYLRKESILHFCAHPVYSVDGRLTVDHLEQLLLLFGLLEAVNGQHTSPEAFLFREVVDRLSEPDLEAIARRHGIDPVGEKPWRKGWVAGSDDHSMLCIAATYTETAPVDSLDAFLHEIARGAGRPAGEPAASMKLAHTIYSGAYNYYRMRFGGRDPERSFVGRFFQRLMEGEPPLSPWCRIRRALPAVRKIYRRVQTRDPNPVAAAFKEEVIDFLELNPDLRRRLYGAGGRPPDQDAIFRLANEVSGRLVQRSIVRLQHNVKTSDFLDMAQTLAALATVYGFLIPYYVSFAHLHKSRALLQHVRNRFNIPLPPADLRLALFTDTLLEVNGVAHTIRTLAGLAREHSRYLRVLTSLAEGVEPPDYVDHLPALGSFDLPEYPELKLNIPSFLEVLHTAERQRFDAVHLSTPGVLGVIGLAVGRMMRVPVVSTYHTDLPRYVATLTGDDKLGELAWKYMRWFYGRVDLLIVPSRATARYLAENGLDPLRMRVLTRGVDSSRFRPEKRRLELWDELHLDGGPKLLYVGRISKEKNLDVLISAFERLHRQVPDARLVLVGDGPYRRELEARAAGPAVRFPGYTTGETLAQMYASADLFVFPSRTDTLGNVVMEAQAAGVPAVVSDEGGPQECIEPGLTGVVVSCTSSEELADSLSSLLQNPERLRSMSVAARARMLERTPQQFLESFWLAHHELLTRPDSRMGEVRP